MCGGRKRDKVELFSKSEREKYADTSHYMVFIF